MPQIRAVISGASEGFLPLSEIEGVEVRHRPLRDRAMGLAARFTQTLFWQHSLRMLFSTFKP